MIDFRTNYGPEFDKVFSEIMDIEGIVMTNDPDDSGGLTICGISRVAHPQWSGWKYTTNFKLNTKVPLDFIVEHVAKFYYENFWLKYSCDKVPAKLGAEIFDQAINPGPAIMTRNLQECLNALNYNTKTKDKDVEDLVVDGKWGKKTRTRLIEYANRYNNFLAKAMNAKQASYYLSLSSSNVKMRKYVKGWMNRV